MDRPFLQTSGCTLESNVFGKEKAMISRSVLILSVVLAIASADTLTLRNGRSVEGQYLGGDARAIRMAVGDHINTFQIDEVANLQFGDLVDLKSVDMVRSEE